MPEHHGFISGFYKCLDEHGCFSAGRQLLFETAKRGGEMSVGGRRPVRRCWSGRYSCQGVSCVCPWTTLRSQIVSYTFYILKYIFTIDSPDLSYPKSTFKLFYLAFCDYSRSLFAKTSHHPKCSKNLADLV